MLNFNKRYTAAQVADTESIEQSPADLPGTLLRVRPHPENDGMHDAAGLLQALYDPQETVFGRNTSQPCSFELWFNEGSITFYLYAPTERGAEKYSRRVANAYKNTAITKVEDEEQAFPTVSDDEYVAGCEMYPEQMGREGKYYPIRHFRDDQGFDSDPYGQITSALLSTDESKVVVQVVFKPAARDWTDGSLMSPGVDDVAENLKADEVVWDPIPRDREATKKDKDAAKVVERQRNSQAFHTNIRVAAISPEKGEAEARAKDLGGMFASYYNATTEQGLEQEAIRGWPSGRRAKKLRAHLGRLHRREYLDTEMLLTVDELAGVAHIPNGAEKGGINTPKIEWRQSQRGDRVAGDSEGFSSEGESFDDEIGQAAGDD
jgi:hypothetical protein